MTKEEAILMSKRVGPLTEGKRPCNLFLIHETSQIQYIVIDSVWYGVEDLYGTEQEIFDEFGTFLEGKPLIRYNMETKTLTIVEDGKTTHFEDFNKNNEA